jgi:hypothetical protein
MEVLIGCDVVGMVKIKEGDLIRHGNSSKFPFPKIS